MKWTADMDELMTLPVSKAAAEMTKLWQEDEYWPLEDAVSEILLARPDIDPDRYARFIRCAKAAIAANEIEWKEVGDQLCITVPTLIAWAVESRLYSKASVWGNFLELCSSIMGDAPHAPVWTELQLRIQEELGKDGMTAPQMTEHLAVLGVDRDLRTIKKAIANLMSKGVVGNRKGLGYYLVDEPPKPSRAR